jgi:D-sedoheptulose 7-phosphate isomerase
MPTNDPPPHAPHAPNTSVPALASLQEAHRVLGVVLADPALVAAIDSAAATLTETLARGSKLLIVGNGGSLCDAMHFAEELTGRFRNDRRPLAALACADASHITCTANDYGFEHIFSRWVTALGRPGDTLIILSTSGNSPNCLRAAEAARAGGLTVLGLLGKGGGTLAAQVHTALTVPGTTSDRIQELHMLILHIWVEEIERRLGL